MKPVTTIANTLVTATMIALLATPLAHAQRGDRDQDGRAGQTRNNDRGDNDDKPARKLTKKKAPQRQNGQTTNVKGGNKVNVGSGNTNVNVNVDNSKDVRIHNERNTSVRRNNNIHYNRPPHRHGGHRYYSVHVYRYHPYRPFHWGPMWHPWGFFIKTLAVTAIVISINNQQYHYDNGVYYVPSNGGYTVVPAPVGATVAVIPPASQTVVVNQTTNNYYYGGTYYEKSDNGYTVVQPTAGTIVASLPEGGEEVKVGDQTYVKVGETYYQPTQVDGKDVYEVMQVEDDK